MNIETPEARKKMNTAKALYLKGALKAVERTIREAEQQHRELAALLESLELEQEEACEEEG